MGNLTGQDKNSVVANITSLDEAKQLILHLLETQEGINTLLGYELRTPLMIIKGYAEMMQREDLPLEHSYFLKIITYHAMRMEGLMNVIRNAALTEWRWRQRAVKEYYPPELIDLRPVIIETVSQIQKSVDFENDIRALQTELDKKKGRHDPLKEPVKFKAIVADNLPTVLFNSSIFEFVMSNVIWLIADPYDEDIFIVAEFDKQWVKMVFGCSTNDSLQRMVEDFQQFETVQNHLEFSRKSIPLYNIWHKIKAYGGKLSLNIQDKTDLSKRSKIEVTLNLKR